MFILSLSVFFHHSLSASCFFPSCIFKPAHFICILWGQIICFGLLSIRIHIHLKWGPDQKHNIDGSSSRLTWLSLKVRFKFLLPSSCNILTFRQVVVLLFRQKPFYPFFFLFFFLKGYSCRNPDCNVALSSWMSNKKRALLMDSTLKDSLQRIGLQPQQLSAETVYWTNSKTFFFPHGESLILRHVNIKPL